MVERSLFLGYRVNWKENICRPNRCHAVNTHFPDMTCIWGFQTKQDITVRLEDEDIATRRRKQSLKTLSPFWHFHSLTETYVASPVRFVLHLLQIQTRFLLCYRFTLRCSREWRNCLRSRRSSVAESRVKPEHSAPGCVCSAMIRG